MVRTYSILFLLLLPFVWSFKGTDPTTEAELGEILFFDPILSQDSTISCASCHIPQLAFADSLAISPGIANRIGRRNAPTIMNMASRDAFFYDGRAKDLIDQVHFPIEDNLEMGAKMSEVVNRIRSHASYPIWFKKIYNETPSEKNVARAIAAFEESLETSDTEFDAWMNDKPNKMSDAAIRGREFFLSDRSKCFDCHFGPDFTGDEFKNIGLYDKIKYKDEGRYEVTKNQADIGKFKVPGLRNIAVTAPYMHDGSFATLKDVIEYYSNPFQFVTNPINMDTTFLKPLNFTTQEKADLEAFLHSLTDKRFKK